MVHHLERRLNLVMAAYRRWRLGCRTRAKWVGSSESLIPGNARGSLIDRKARNICRQLRHIVFKRQLTLCCPLAQGQVAVDS